MLLFLVLGDWAFAALRVITGAIFVVHGWPKLSNLKQTQTGFDGMGFRPGKFWGTLVAIVEFFGGLALALGFLTHLVALVLAAQFVVILVWRILKRERFAGAMEYDLLLLGVLLVLTTIGGGILSFDRSLFLRGW